MPVIIEEDNADEIPMLVIYDKSRSFRAVFFCSTNF